jgi:small subunit ribosomal protein S6
MNKYELTLVLEGKNSSAKKKKVTETLEKILKVLKAKVVESKDWGVKDLAYKLDKNEQGAYLHFVLEMEAPAVKALNEKLRTDSDILRFLLIRVEK